MKVRRNKSKIIREVCQRRCVPTVRFYKYSGLGAIAIRLF